MNGVNAFFLMLPLFLLRFGLLGIISKAALGRAALFAPPEGKEKTAYLLYQVSNVFILLYPFFLKLQTRPSALLIGLPIYLLGIAILIMSTVAFAKPDQSGLNTNGIYEVSRNPMYMGYFLYFLGCAALTRSIPLLLAVLVFQISAHQIILSEERWCIKKFGSEYVSYMERVRRYF